MSVFFEEEPAIEIQGDGVGNIIFKKFDSLGNVLEQFSISEERFSKIIEYFAEDLTNEAWNRKK